MEVINEFEKMLNDTAKTIVENNMDGVDMYEVDIIPVNNNVLIQPYLQNPYRYIETTASGLIVGVESSKTYKSNETGEIEQNNEVVKCGKVLAVGPACKNVNVGDDVYYTTYSEAKLPFRKKGYVIVGEGLLICRIVKKDINGNV
jgi:co-chaperonin GroES (HSP10)